MAGPTDGDGVVAPAPAAGVVTMLVSTARAPDPEGGPPPAVKAAATPATMAAPATPKATVPQRQAGHRERTRASGEALDPSSDGWRHKRSSGWIHPRGDSWGSPVPDSSGGSPYPNGPPLSIDSRLPVALADGTSATTHLASGSSP
jgi:hypothetical protein